MKLQPWLLLLSLFQERGEDPLNFQAITDNIERLDKLSTQLRRIWNLEVISPTPLPRSESAETHVNLEDTGFVQLQDNMVTLTGREQVLVESN